MRRSCPAAYAAATLEYPCRPSLLCAASMILAMFARATVKVRLPARPSCQPAADTLATQMHATVGGRSVSQSAPLTGCRHAT